ncbi:MAG: hypothetical protein AAGA18_05630 [Verrucomicrobiota bacterium]
MRATIQVSILGCFFFCLSTSCSRDEISVYKAPKDAVTQHEKKTEPYSSDKEVTFEVSALPNGWKQVPASQLVLAAYDTGVDAQATITAFPGDVGGVFANVNRWRRQMGLPPAVDSDLNNIVQRVQLGKSVLNFVEIHGSGEQSGQSVLVYFFMKEGKTWFYKMSGGAKDVQTQKEVFTQFVESIEG